jgi:phage baseplate assembly protein W
MNDLQLTWGSDLTISPTGDLAIIDGQALGQQRIIRRLLTNNGDYVWHPTYGAGLASFVGSPVSPAEVRAIVRSQIFRERSVAQTPEPIVTVNAASEGNTNTNYVTIEYSDNSVVQAQVLTLDLGP